MKPDIEYYTVGNGYYISQRFCDPATDSKDGVVKEVTLWVTPKLLSEMPYLCNAIPMLVFPLMVSNLGEVAGREVCGKAFARAMNRMNLEMALLAKVGSDMGIGDNEDYPLQMGLNSPELIEITRVLWH